MRSGRLNSLGKGLRGAAVLGFLAVFSAAALAQNPVPFVNLPLVPDAAAPGGPEFTLTVNGTGFMSGAVVDWNGSPLATQFVSRSRLTATVPAADIAIAGTASVTVVNPAPGGGTSSVVFFTTANPSSSVSFGAVESVPGGNNWGAVAVGDFNGDGNLDVASFLSDNVNVLLGDGKGNFNLASSSTVGHQPSSVVVSDFNGDGKLDLAIANWWDGTLSILLGDGAGNFNLVSSPAVGNFPKSVAVGDFNGDGKLDLAVATPGDNTISILLGDGTGNFTLTSSPATDGAGSVAVGDFNADGNLDLAVTNLGTDTVSILVGDGTGNFTLGASPAVGSTPTSVAVGDFNGDGNLDLAVANYCHLDVTRAGYCVALPSTVSILLGDGRGNFDLASSPTVGVDPDAVATADFNSDGNLDVAVANESSNTVSILLGDGKRNFIPASSPVVDINSLALAVGDFNGDGKLDLAIERSPAGSILLQVLAPGISLSPLGCTFGNQLVSTTSRPQAVTVINIGSGSLDISSIAASGDFAQTNTCGSTVAAGANCTISVTFTPTAAGVRGGAITISDNANGSPQIVNLSGTGIVSGVSASLSTTSLTFPNQVVQTTSAPQAVTLTNTGTATLNITSIVSSGDFAETNTCGNSLASGASCTVSVTFTPTQAGTRTGSVTITDNAPDSPQSVVLTGQGVTAVENTVGFGYFRFENGTPGQVASGTNSILDSSPYQNNGTPMGSMTYSSDVPSVGIPNSVSLQFNAGYSDALAFDKTFPFNQQGLDVSLDFWLKSSLEQYEEVFGTKLDSSDTNRFNLALNNNGTLALDYRDPDGNLHQLVGAVGSGVPVPADTWSHLNITRLGNEYFVLENGQLMATAVDSSPNLPTNVGWAIAGRSGFSFQGLIDEVQVSPVLSSIVLTAYALTFGDQVIGTTGGAQSVTVTNLGSAPANIANIAASGDFAQSNTCGTALASGANCTISITFTPTAAGTRTGTITIDDDASGSPQIVQLTGTGSELGVSPASLTFKSQNVGTSSTGQFVTVTNHGAAAVSLTGVATTGDFEATRPCPSVPPEGTCKILVIFRPTGTGQRTGVLTINDSEPSQATVALSGTGTAPSVSLSTGNLTFDGQDVNTSSPAQSVMLTNTGDGPLTIGAVTTSGDYAATAGHCAGTVAAGASCEITVVFKPLLAGNRTGSLSIADNAAGNPQTVTLSGTGEDFTLSARTMSATVTAGQTASYTLSLASEDGFSGTVTLTCTGAPATAACSLSPSAAILAASDATLVTVGVTTTARSMAPPRGRHRLPGPASPGVRWLLALLIMLAIIAWTWRGSALPKRALLRVPLSTALLLVALWAACGGSSGGTFAPSPVAGTPAGTYTLTVAASGSGVTTNVTLTLVVN